MAVATVMEPYTLVIWLMMGQRFEEVTVPNLSDTECAELVVKIVTSRRRFGQCIGPPVIPATERSPIRDCASHHYYRGSCVWPLPPGRRRI